MALFWQIVVFLLVAAALGFVIGWLTRGARAQGGMEPALANDGERLRLELAAARDAQGQLETSLVEAREFGDSMRSRARGLEEAQERSRERIGRLEQELSEARAGRDQPGSFERAATALTAPRAGTPPPALPSPEGAPDDLKKISGIGPGIEKTLHELGIYHFRQIAQLTPDHVAWIDHHLRFRGRIQREDWIGQARKLTAGETLDLSAQRMPQTRD